MSSCESGVAPMAAKSLRISMSLYVYLPLVCEHRSDEGDFAHAPLSPDLGQHSALPSRQLLVQPLLFVHHSVLVEFVKSFTST